MTIFTRMRAIATSLFVFVMLLALAASAQTAPEAQRDITKVPAAAQPSDHFDVDAATDAYLALMPATAKARSDAYFEGGYWLILWDFLVGAIIALLLLNLGWSASMRNLAERITRFKWLQTFLYWIEYLLLTSVLGFPLAVYEGYFREWKYGLATQTFGPWMWDQIKGLGVNAVLGGIITVLLFWVVRKLPRTWWIWGAVVTTAFLVFVIMIVPVFIVPVFNKLTRLDDPKVTTPILAMARANGIPAQDVWTMDASKQTTRMSANVSGFGKTMRITLNDNLLRRGSPEEIESVMGHEMGHYVLNHISKDIKFFADCHGAGVCLPALVAGLVSETLGNEVGDSRRQRSGGAAAGGAAGVDLVLCADTDYEHARSHGRSRGGHVRNQCQPAA